jgi:hypothetical protein
MGVHMSIKPMVLLAFLLFSLTASAKTSADDNLSNSNVYVPWEDFKGILDRLSEPEPVNDTSIVAPVDYVLTSADISGVVIDKTTADFSVLLDLTVLPGSLLKTNGWVSIPLGRQNSSSVPGTITIKGKSIPLTVDNDQYVLLLSEAGRYTVELTYHSTLSVNEGTSHIELSLPKCMAANLEFTIPDEHADVIVNGLKTITQGIAHGLKVKTAVAVDDILQIEYTPIGNLQEGDDSGRITPRMYAASGLFVDIKENQIKYQYRVDYQIWHKKQTSFSIAMPDTFPIEEVEGAGISKWKVERQEGKPVLTVNTNFTPVRDYSLTVKFNQKLESVNARFTVPSLRVLNVHRENGCIAIKSSQAMEVEVHDSLDGVTAIDQSELHSWLQAHRDLLMMFKYINPPFTLNLNVKRHSDMPVLVTIADTARFTTLITKDGYALSKIQYKIRNNHKQYLRVKMGDGWQLWSSLIDGHPVMPASAGKNELLVPLRKMSAHDTRGFMLELVYWRELKKMRFSGNLEFSMPVIDINSQRIEGDIWTPKGFTYKTFKGTLIKSGTIEGSDTYRIIKNENSNESVSSQVKRFSMGANMQAGKGQQRLALTLPVEIEVPTGGYQHTLAKNLTIAGEHTQCTFSFRKALPDFGNSAGIFLQVLFLVTGFFAVIIPLRHRTRAVLYMSIVGGIAALILLVIIKTGSDCRGAGILLFFIGAIIAPVTYGAFTSRKIAAEGSLLIIFCAIFLINPSNLSAQEEIEEFRKSTVAIPWYDFKGIVDKIKKPLNQDPEAVVPPVPYVISAGDYKGHRLNDHQFEFMVTLTLSVLERTSWVTIPLMQSTAIYPDIKINMPPSCKAVIGSVSGDNEYGYSGNTIVVKGCGTYEIKYRFAAQVNELSGVSEVVFPMPLQAAASISVELDKKDYIVKANEIPLSGRLTNNNHTVYSGAVGCQENAKLSWRQEVTQISVQDAMLLGNVNTMYSIGTGLVLMNSDITLTVIHQDINECSLTLPASTDVIDITGPSVLTWEKVDSVSDSKRQTIKVLFKYSVHDNTVINLRAEQVFSDSVSIVSMPDLLLKNASQQEGFIAVGVTSNIELSQNELSANVFRKDQRELPSGFKTGDDQLFAYQYLSGLYHISFTIKRHENVSGLTAIAENSVIRSVMRDDGKTITELTMWVKNRGEQFLRYKWKPGWQLWSLHCNNEPGRPSYDSLTRELLVPLEKRADRSANTIIKLVYLEQNVPLGFAGKRTIELPSVNMPMQNISYAAYIPSDVEILRTKGNLHQTEDERKAKTPWFRWIIDLNNIGFDLSGEKVNVATGFYEKTPEESTARFVTTTEEERLPRQRKSLSQFKSLDRVTGGGGDPRMRSAQMDFPAACSRGSQTSSTLVNKESVATGVDAIMARTGALNRYGGGGTGRKGVAGVGYGAGYGSGFGGSGSGGVDDLIGNLMGGDGGSASNTAAIEAGQLSLSMDISFDGKLHSYRNVLMKPGENPLLSFYFRKVPAKTSSLISFAIFILTLTAGVFLTRCVWLRFKWRTVLYGIIFPVAIALIISRWYGKPLTLDWILLTPLAFFAWRTGIFIGQNIKRAKEKEAALIKEIEEHNVSSESN